MINISKTFISLLFLVSTVSFADSNTTVGYSPTVNIIETFSASDSAAVPGTWLKLGQIQLNTASSISVGAGKIGSCGTVWCTGGTMSLVYGAQTSYSVYMTRTPATVTDDAGNTYQITVAFPEGFPDIGISEANTGGRTWNGTLPAESMNNFFEEPENSSDSFNSKARTGHAWCGNRYGCKNSFAAYYQDGSKMPYIYLKLPANLSARTITFTSKKVMSMHMEMTSNNKSVITDDVALYLSGSILVPQRCYINADKSSFNFGTVYSNSTDKTAGNQTMTLTTDCYYAPEGATQYLKMEAVSGGTLNNDRKKYSIAKDASFVSALDIIFNINNSADCTSDKSDKNVFNTEYLVRKIKYQAHQSATDTVYFSLCKYGVPSVTGQKSIVLKLTSKWVSS